MVLVFCEYFLDISKEDSANVFLIAHTKSLQVEYSDQYLLLILSSISICSSFIFSQGGGVDGGVNKFVFSFTSLDLIIFSNKNSGTSLISPPRNSYFIIEPSIHF